MSEQTPQEVLRHAADLACSGPYRRAYIAGAEALDELIEARATIEQQAKCTAGYEKNHGCNVA